MTTTMHKALEVVSKLTGEVFKLSPGQKVRDANNHEILDPTPVAMPVGFKKRPAPLYDQVRAMVRQASMEAEALGEESFEEADDFDVGDDYDPHSPYEINFDHENNYQNLKEQVATNRARKRKGDDFEDQVPNPQRSGSPAGKRAERAVREAHEESTRTGEVSSAKRNEPEVE